MKRNVKILIIFLIIILALAACQIFWLMSRSSLGIVENNFSENNKNMTIVSSAFLNGQAIPIDYGCRGADINPPLEIGEIPKEAKSLALLVDDPDAPAGDWVHWIVWNIDPQTTTIAANGVPKGSVAGLNDFGSNRYEGPCPPSGTHRYQYKVYALDLMLNLKSTTQKPELLQAISGHVLDQAILVGKYSK